MATECNNCGAEKPNDRFKCCESCRAAWRKDKRDDPNLRDYWIAFFGHGIESRTNIADHNFIADCRVVPDFIGMARVKINMSKLER